jgi:hypothetical protein|tara:strand:- start:1993 stop:2325 length:333 start_codon:yes stop_codon:yes gene_type:complete
MNAVHETTVWEDDAIQPNHTYLMDGDKAVAYIKWGQGDAFYFKTPWRLDRRKRKFEAVVPNPFTVKIESRLIKVDGSKGAVYYVDPDAKTCTCPGNKFRGTCKHIDEIGA